MYFLNAFDRSVPDVPDDHKYTNTCSSELYSYYDLLFATQSFIEVHNMLKNHEVGSLFR